MAANALFGDVSFTVEDQLPFDLRIILDVDALEVRFIRAYSVMYP